MPEENGPSTWLLCGESMFSFTRYLYLENPLPVLPDDGKPERARENSEMRIVTYACYCAICSLTFCSLVGISCKWLALTCSSQLVSVSASECYKRVKGTTRWPSPTTNCLDVGAIISPLRGASHIKQPYWRSEYL